jgi:hypothetical protein
MKKKPSFMAVEGSLPSSQKHANGPSHKLYAVRAVTAYFLKIHFNITLSSKTRSSIWSFSSAFPTKVMHAFTSPSHSF